MPDTDCPICGNQGRLATNHSLTWYKCMACRETYAVSHTRCAVSSCTAGVDHDQSGLCWYHAAHQGIHPDGDPYQADHGKADEERPAMCSHPGCNALADHGGRCWQHPPTINEEDTAPDAADDDDETCSHAGCPNRAQQGGVCWYHGAATAYPDEDREGD